MSRKPPSDAFTRFTSTTPSSSSSQSFTYSPPISKSQPQPAQNNAPPRPPPPSQPETAQERVSRLRAAHRARIAASYSTTDRIVARGRTVADYLHRGTTYTLLGFSVLASLVAAYGLVSLVSHNRTQKRAWIEREMDRLESARAAFLKGTADAEQLHLLEQERAGEELKKKWDREKDDKKWFRPLRQLFGKGDLGRDAEQLTMEERGRKLREGERTFEEAQQRQSVPQRFMKGGEEVEVRSAVVGGSAVQGVGLDAKGRPVPVGKMEQVRVQKDSSVLEQMQEQTATRTPGALARSPGPLDMAAANITGSGSIWLGSIFGGSR